MIGHSSASSVSVMEWSQGLVMSHVFFKCFAMCFSHPLDSCVFPVCAALCCLVLLLIIKLLQYIILNIPLRTHLIIFLSVDWSSTAFSSPCFPHCQPCSLVLQILCLPARLPTQPTFRLPYIQGYK